MTDHLTYHTDIVRSSSTHERECAACGGYINFRTRLCADPAFPECVMVTINTALETAEAPR